MSVCLLGAECNNVWLRETHPYEIEIVIPGTMISMACALCVFLLLYIERRPSIQSGFVISVYLSTSLLLSLAEDSIYTRPGLFATPSTTKNVLKLLVLALEAISKISAARLQGIKRMCLNAIQTLCQMLAAVAWIRTTAISVTRFLRMDFLQDLPPELTSETLYREFMAVWTDGK